MIVSSIWLNDRFHSNELLESRLNFSSDSLASWKEFSTCCILGSNAISQKAERNRKNSTFNLQDLYFFTFFLN